LVVHKIYEGGSVYDPSILDITSDDLARRFFQGVTTLASISLAIGYPTAASLPHHVVNGFKKLVAIALETGYMFPEAQKFKDYLDNPDAFVAAAPAAGGWGDEGETKVVAASTETPGWGDDKETKSDKSDKKDSEDKDDSKKKSSEPAWDDEGHGKMTLEEFQKTVAAKRAQDLEALKVGVKSAGRQIENTVDLSKCFYKDTTDEKEKKLAEERKKEKAEDAKRRGQQRAGTQSVDLSEYIDVRTRGGRGGRGGGRGGDRPPRGAEGQEQASPEPSRAARGGRGGRGGGGGGNRVPKKDAGRDAFPALAPAAPPKATK
jgi:hypothetical protein